MFKGEDKLGFFLLIFYQSNLVSHLVSFIFFSLNIKADGSSSETNNSEILNFESLKYSTLYNPHEILLDNSCDPDKNFFDTDIQNIDTPCILPEDFESFSCKLNSKSFSILHLNIRSLKKNF